MRKMLLLVIAIVGVILWPGLSWSKTQNRFLPPDGKTFVMIGQDRDTIMNYLHATGHQPAGFMVYTSIQELNGLDKPADYGAGVQHAQELNEHYPGVLFQVGLYMVNALDGVVQGKYDENIKKLAVWIKKSSGPVYLRIGYEFDFPDNHYDPKLYQKAYRYIVDHLRAEGVTNAAYVWHSYGYINPEKPIMDWYPGDEYVDFFAVSFFKAFNMGNMNFILKRAAEHHKPFMIAEATPFGVGTQEGQRSWSLWFKPFFEFIEKNKIPIVSYIDSDWETLPMFKGQGWGDARVEANPIVKELWMKEMQDLRFSNVSLSDYDQTKKK